jgi:hypothetical protein
MDRNGIVFGSFGRLEFQIGAAGSHEGRPAISERLNAPHLSTTAIVLKVTKKGLGSCIPESFVGNSSLQIGLGLAQPG